MGFDSLVSCEAPLVPPIAAVVTSTKTGQGAPVSFVPAARVKSYIALHRKETISLITNKLSPIQPSFIFNYFTITHMLTANYSSTIYTETL